MNRILQNYLSRLLQHAGFAPILNEANMFLQYKQTQICLRILAAVFGGYALTSGILATLALCLPWPKVDTLFFLALLPAFIALAALLWSFAAPSAQRAWRDILIATLFCSLPALAAVLSR